MDQRLHPLRTRTIFEAPWLRLEALEMDERGQSPHYRIVDAPGVICVTLSGAGDFVMIRQPRPTVESMTLEFPAGGVEAGETAMDAVRREVFEETGRRVIHLGLVGETEPVPNRVKSHQTLFVGIVEAEASGAVAERGARVEIVPRAKLKSMLLNEVSYCMVAIGALKLAELRWDVDIFKDSISTITQRIIAQTARASC
jgi:ADP-ribose pyrophosphatase